MHPRHALVALGLLAGAASAQLTDLQPGPNYPAAVTALGTGGHSEEGDVGDVDNDGDLDVGVAEGGDFGPQPNRIWINQGGSAGGVQGSFLEETAVRFGGVPADTSRDLEFVDFDDDGDLDAYITNRGTTSNGGEVSRAYINRGGKQGGAVGFFREGTDDFWGALVSVPPSHEVGAVDGQGPFRNYACDCDFADLNDDGHIDLFASSYGPNINGSRDSRIFLNDGTGTFDELWPWVEPGADIRLHTRDTELVDLDGDFDIDVFGSSRDSQSRVYRNNLNGSPGATALFTDITQSALLDTGAGLIGSNNYDCEYGDVDGDGDFDVWMLNYCCNGGGNRDRVLRNNGDLTFTKMDAWIQGDPNLDENEIDFVDYDSDGDLDAFVANYTGTNLLYVNGTAQGLPEAQGVFHRTTSGAALAPWQELPATGNGYTSLDGESADLDGDGDPDLMLFNDKNQENRLYENVLGVPDTFAPTFAALTEQGDTSSGADVVIHAAVRDNSPYQLVALWDADLIYTVDGGPARCVRMVNQGSMQFRGVIPGSLTGEIAYHVEVADDAGNVGVSQTIVYDQVGGAAGGWQSLSCGTAGVAGVPSFAGQGLLVPGAPTAFVLRDAAPEAVAVLFLALASTPVPFKQGTLHPWPAAATIPRTTDDGGLDHLAVPWPDLTLFPSGTELYAQYGVQDAAHPSGVTLSNAILATVP